MARCLTPLTIKSPSKGDSLHACPAAFWRSEIRPYMNDSLVVPCGKCINCLKNKQSSMVVRIKREAEKRGSLSFVTLTYDDDHLPLMRSLWSVDRDTGEYILESPGEIISSGRMPDLLRLGQIKEMIPSDRPRYLDIDIPGFDGVDGNKRYFVRITPSVCREDVRLWLKRARVAYKRAFDKVLDISYCLVSEYGPRTCRPHYHLAIMGIDDQSLRWLVSLWKYGFTKCDRIDRVQANNPDPWSSVSFYIGKYMSKGKFECPSVLDGSAQKPRVCQSLGLGVGDFEALKPYVCAFDIYGAYDLDTLFCPALGRRLNDLETQVLVEQIPKRLVYKLNDKITLPLPRLIRNRIFFKFDVYEKPVSTRIWYLVKTYLRDKYASLDQQEFTEFLSANFQRTLSENCVAFERSKSYAASLEAQAGETDLQMFYSGSVF